MEMLENLQENGGKRPILLKMASTAEQIFPSVADSKLERNINIFMVLNFYQQEKICWKLPVKIL